MAQQRFLEEATCPAFHADRELLSASAYSRDYFCAGRSNCHRMVHRTRDVDVNLEVLRSHFGGAG